MKESEVTHSVDISQKYERRTVLHTLLHGDVIAIVFDNRCSCGELLWFDGSNAGIFSGSRDHIYTRDIVEAWLFSVCVNDTSFREAYRSVENIRHSGAAALVTDTSVRAKVRANIMVRVLRSAFRCRAAPDPGCCIEERDDRRDIIISHTLDRKLRLCVADIIQVALADSLPGVFIERCEDVPFSEQYATKLRHIGICQCSGHANQPSTACLADAHSLGTTLRQKTSGFSRIHNHCSLNSPKSQL